MTILTEEEAKKRWCPFSRVATTNANSPSWNRLSGRQKENGPLTMQTPEATLCIGSQCMAWRWSVTPTGWSYRTGGGRARVTDFVKSDSHGCCGAFGKVENGG
jgi:hypothetical protein